MRRLFTAEVVMRSAVHEDVSPRIDRQMELAGVKFRRNQSAPTSYAAYYESTKTTLRTGKHDLSKLLALNNNLKGIMLFAVPDMMKNYTDMMKSHDVAGVSHNQFCCLLRPGVKDRKCEGMNFEAQDQTSGEHLRSLDADVVKDNLIKWMELIDAESDYETVATSFGDCWDFGKFFNLIKVPPSQDLLEDQKEQFLFLFDEVAKTLIHSWFQLHFLDDVDTDGLADIGGNLWEEIESRVVRQNMRRDQWWTDIPVTRASFNKDTSETIVQPKIRQSDFDITLSDWLISLRTSSPSALMAATVLDPVAGKVIENHIRLSIYDINEIKLRTLVRNQVSQSHYMRPKLVWDVYFDEIVDPKDFELFNTHNRSVQQVLRSVLPAISMLAEAVSGQEECNDVTDFECTIKPVVQGELPRERSLIPQAAGQLSNRMAVPEKSEANQTNVADDARMKVGQMTTNIDLWLEKIDFAVSSTRVSVAFASGADVSNLVELIKKPPPEVVASDEKEFLVDAFDRVFKEVVYFWFQQNFLEDEKGEQDGTPDFDGSTWQEIESSALRRRILHSELQNFKIT